MHRLRRTLLAIALATGLAGCAKVELRFQPEPGSSFKLILSAKQNITQSPGGRTLEFDQEITMESDVEVAAGTKPEERRLTFTYRRIAYWLKGSQGELDFDSARPESEIQSGTDAGRIFRGLIGESFTLDIGPDGSVRKAQNEDAFFTGLVRKLGSTPDIAGESFRAQAREFFGPAAFREQLQRALLRFPEQVVGAGDAWEGEQTYSSGFPIIVNQKNEVLSAGEEVRVRTYARVRSNREAAPVDTGGSRLKYLLSGEQWGELTVTARSGLQPSGEVRQELSGTVVVDESTTLPPGYNWPMWIKSVYTMETRDIQTQSGKSP